jgi:hypothetical protein
MAGSAGCVRRSQTRRLPSPTAHRFSRPPHAPARCRHPPLHLHHRLHAPLPRRLRRSRFRRPSHMRLDTDRRPLRGARAKGRRPAPRSPRRPRSLLPARPPRLRSFRQQRPRRRRHRPRTHSRTRKTLPGHSRRRSPLRHRPLLRRLVLALAPSDRPDPFVGCWSTSPDPVDFRAFQTMNPYADRSGHWTDAG